LNTQPSLTYYSTWDLALTLPLTLPRASSLDLGSHEGFNKRDQGPGTNHLSGIKIHQSDAQHREVSEWKGQVSIAGKQGPRSSTTIGAPVPIPRDFAVTGKASLDLKLGPRRKRRFFIFKLKLRIIKNLTNYLLTI
jgi:hypothetical protein